jgi:hypothetical protein
MQVMELQKGKSYVTVVGKAKVTDKTFALDQTSQSGYQYSRLNLGIETEEGNVIYGEMMGGYTPQNPVIYTFGKEDGSSLQINWADRFNESIIDSVADFRLFKAGLERDENGKLIVKRFLSPYDMIAYLKEKLVDGMEVTVRGSFQFSEYNGNTQRRFQIQNIFLASPKKDEKTGELLPIEHRATFVQTILLDEESFKKITKEDAEAGEVVVSAYAVDYVGKKNGKEIKKNLPFSLPIVVKINKENPEMTKKILDALFKVKKGKVRELTIEGNIIEGYEKQEISDADIELSPEIKELIAMGLYSEEEAKKKMTVRGNKVSKLVFTRPYLVKDKEGNLKIDMDDEKYTADDLIVPIEEEEATTTEADPFDVGQSTSSSDDSWLSALGIN